MKLIRKTRNLDKLIKRVTALCREEVATGYFPENGIHYGSGLAYATLMAMHHQGYEGKYAFVPARKVRTQVALDMKSLFPSWGKQVNNYLYHDKSLRDTLDFIGRLSATRAYDIFGDKSELAPNSAYTIHLKNSDSPLVDTGELRDNWSYKSSVGQLVKIGYG